MAALERKLREHRTRDGTPEGRQNFPRGSIVEIRTLAVSADKPIERAPLHVAVYHPNVFTDGKRRAFQMRGDIGQIISISKEMSRLNFAAVESLFVAIGFHCG